ncbi:MAG TPA: cation:proton antiporter [Acidobacteriota bacterium]|nr:cation:proton antiporter [Acidobacteriota bacterium]
MTHSSLSDPALTVALALAAGLIAQALARHLRLPGIVLTLGAGVVLGPDLLNLIHPGALGPALRMLIGFAVAVILFEGGLNLNIARLRRESRTIQRLVTVGAVITGAGGTLAAHYILGFTWELAVLFGTLVIVTGPTVISPLVRRIRLNRNLQTILEAEGVLIDPIGALIAVVALEAVLQPGATSFLTGLYGITLKLVVGAAVGAVGGFVIALLLRPRNLVPEGLENVLTLSLVLALFHVSDALQSESGIVAVTIAGLVVGNIRTRALRDLMEFKEQLTVMFIGMLFVLLAADVRYADARPLGVPGLVTVGVLMFAVRPLNVMVSTLGSSLGMRERAFLAWLAPRGIVAAAIASFFADRLAAAGIAGGEALRAMTFMVIAVTVLVQGLTGGPVASLLRVRRKAHAGFAILGAHELGRAMARALKAFGEDVLLLDANADAVKDAQAGGFRVVYGNALEERTLQRAALDSIAVAVGLTGNEEVNQLFIRRAREEFKVPQVYSIVGGHVTSEMIHETGGHVLFGCDCDVDLWSVRLRRGLAKVERWRRTRMEERRWPDDRSLPETMTGLLLPLVMRRNRSTRLADETTEFKEKDEVSFLVFSENRSEAVQWLVSEGWVAVGERETEGDREDD